MNARASQGRPNAGLVLGRDAPCDDALSTLIEVRKPAPRVQAAGKQFAVNGEPFRFRGVTYGTFRPRNDGARFPEPPRLRSDLEAMTRAGFTVVRTYTEPTDDLLVAADEFGLKVLAGIWYSDWRYLVGCSGRQRRAFAKTAAAEVGAAARRLAGSSTVLGLCLGNEVPADVVRWEGAKEVSHTLATLAREARSEDPEMLLTYGNYPSAEYLALDEFDFLTVNVFLERQAEFRRYLTRLQHVAGDRPLVIGELGLDAGGTDDGERRQASVLGWQLETVIERGVAGACVFSWTDEWWVGEQAVEGWHFGLTDAERRPRPALQTAQVWNGRDVRDLDVNWPTISVVVCAYNAAETLDECLLHTCALDYPGLEVIVVDDGSTDATADIVRLYPAARLVGIQHAGLASARNAGLLAAHGELVAYLDSDAFPTPDWPYYLALGLDGPTIAGVGGPNLPPPQDGPVAQQVARAPGGPVHVLLTDDRAEHVPGCNMAFWRQVLHDIGGFDPVFTAAGDDVDACWRVLDSGWEIGFHPAAVVWHHRRSSFRGYLKQQRGYGYSETAVEARHPNRFSPVGTARWRGRIYDAAVPQVGRQRIYRGLYGVAPYQSVYGAGGDALDFAHQIGVPLAALVAVTSSAAWLFAEAAPHVPGLRLLRYALVGAAAGAALAFLAGLFVVDYMRTRLPRRVTAAPRRFRANVALLHLLQPVTRAWGRRRASRRRHRPLPRTALPEPLATARGGVLVFREDRPRSQFAATIVDYLRRGGLRGAMPTGWEAYDVRVFASLLVSGDVVSSAHPVGAVQVRVRRRLRTGSLTVLAAGIVVAAVIGSAGGLWLIAVATALDLSRGWWRTGAGLRRMLGSKAR